MNFEDKILKAKEFVTEILTKLKEICDILYVFRGEPMYDNNMFNGHISYINVINEALVFNLTYINNAGEFDIVTCKVPIRYFDMTKEELIKGKIELDKNNVWYGGINIDHTYFSQINALASRVDSIAGYVDWLLNHVD